jgi:hypothetical protein
MAVVVVPTPMMAVAVMAPAHFLRLKAINFALAGDGRLHIALNREPPVRTQHLRHQRRGLGGGSGGGNTRNDAQRNPQEIAAFHDIFPLPQWRVMRTKFRCADMNAR